MTKKDTSSKLYGQDLKNQLNHHRSRVISIEDKIEKRLEMLKTKRPDLYEIGYDELFLYSIVDDHCLSSDEMVQLIILIEDMYNKESNQTEMF